MSKRTAWTFLILLNALFFIGGFFGNKFYTKYATTIEKPKVVIEKLESKTNLETSFRFNNLW